MDIPWLPRWSVTLGALAYTEGARVPWYMGPAWYLPYTDRFVYMPMPVNWIAAWARQCWIRARRIEIADQIAEAYRYGHNKGFAEGRNSGYDMGIRHAKMLFGDRDR
jgi:hypothetical protein